MGKGKPWPEPFNIDKCGVSLVNAHSQGDSHQKLEKENLN